MPKLRAFLTTIRELPAVFKVCGAIGVIGCLLTWLPGDYWPVGPLVALGAALYVNGWIRGYKKGGDTVQSMYVDGHVEAMEKVVERVNEEYAPDAPERVAAHKQLADLRRVQRELER